MRVAVFSSKPYDRNSLASANAAFGHDLTFLEPRLDQATVVLAAGYPAVYVFVNDQLDAAVLAGLARGGTRLVALRSAGFNNVDLEAADAHGIGVVRVPAYSPWSVAEFTISLLLSLERKVHRAWARVRENDFSLDGLLGRELHGRTVGVVGTGRIGELVAKALKLGFGCEVLAYDVHPNQRLQEIGIEYTSIPDLLSRSDILTLHCPLTPDTHHLVNADSIARAKPGFLLVNTSRGALVDADAVIDGLKSGRIGGVALDVYEQEADLFFQNLSNEIIHDDVFQRLLTFPNVLITGHQAFFTQEALSSITRTTLQNISDAEAGRALVNRVPSAQPRKAE